MNLYVIKLKKFRSFERFLSKNLYFSLKFMIIWSCQTPIFNWCELIELLIEFFEKLTFILLIFDNDLSRYIPNIVQAAKLAVEGADKIDDVYEYLVSSAFDMIAVVTLGV